VATKAKSKGYDAPNILVDRVEAVPVADLTMFHKNPRIGNVDKIAESLKTNGQFKPIVVNVGTETGRPNEILAGNHTWLGTKRNGDALILAAFVDVDEQTATRINLADNATADAGEYDDTILADLLATLPSAVGTGYSQTEMDDLLSGIDLDVSSDLNAIDAHMTEQERLEAERQRQETFEGASLGDEPLPPREPPRRPGEEVVDETQPPHKPEVTIEGMSDELKGGYDLKEDMAISEADFLGKWGIPRLRDDMLADWDDLPDNLDSWAGSACKYDPDKDWPKPDQWWLYNWGIDSTSGMQDVSKVIVSFYAHDEYFDNWWWYPQRYTTKVLNSGIKTIVTPDFSMRNENEGKAISLWQVYRQRWLGRYFQEAGLKVIPNVTWSWIDLDLLTEVILPTLPKGLPLLALQMQTVTEKPEDIALITKTTQQIIDTVEPKDLLIYYGSMGRRIFEDNVKFDGRIKWVESRMVKLSEKAKGRERKKTI
jgi:hypothetical protein